MVGPMVGHPSRWPSLIGRSHHMALRLPFGGFSWYIERVWCGVGREKGKRGENGEILIRVREWIGCICLLNLNDIIIIVDLQERANRCQS